MCDQTLSALVQIVIMNISRWWELAIHGNGAKAWVLSETGVRKREKK